MVGSPTPCGTGAAVRRLILLFAVSDYTGYEASLLPSKRSLCLVPGRFRQRTGR